MATDFVSLNIRPRGKLIRGLPEETRLQSWQTTNDLYQEIATKIQYSVHRLRITKGSDGSLVPCSKDVTIDGIGLRDRSNLFIKDLGPQVSWRTVFIIEYLGPMLIHALIYYLRPYIYGTVDQPSERQRLCLLLLLSHFLKREIETIFVHRFSLATMPAFNIVKNSAHYWFLSGLNIAYWIYSPKASIAGASNPVTAYLGIALFMIGELGNFKTHITLRNLRRSGSTERGIPRGTEFDLVTCPNYMFEITAWIGFTLISWSISSVIFTIFGTVQMMAWAKKKERRYRKDFGGKYKPKKYVIFPGLY